MKLLNDLYTIRNRYCGESGYDFTIELNPQHFIYKAHFPGEPITPGVCIMQIAKELLEEALSQPLALSCVKNIKFLRIISPAEVTVLDYSLTRIVCEDGLVKVQVNVLSGENLYAKLSLVCQTVA